MKIYSSFELNKIINVLFFIILNYSFIIYYIILLHITRSMNFYKRINIHKYVI